MGRTRVRRRRALLGMWLVVAAVAIGPIGHAMSAGASDRRVPTLTYVVRPGDTLWGIARRVAPGQDPRIVVARVAASNGIDAGELEPGRSLVIPLG